ncbi:MAG: hypothetical protein NVSMB51_14260 [Solirubrobacteraceae bacterium]
MTLSGAPPALVRRAVLAPLLMLLGLLTALLSPLLLGVAALASVFDARRLRPLRLTWLLMSYILYDAAATAAAFTLWLRFRPGGRLRGERSAVQHYALFVWFLAGTRRQAERASGFKLKLDGASAAAEAVLRARERPVLLLARHADFGDSFLIVDELLGVYRRRPEIVMKGALTIDPIINVYGNRLPNCFLDPANTGELSEAVGRLAAGLRADSALVLFPEGANFTAPRRRRAIARLLRGGRRKQARAALRLHNVLPPRVGGALAAIENAPGAEVIFCAHAQMPSARTLRELWRELPLRGASRVRYWHVPPQQVPADSEAREAWLFAWWEEIDVWIGGAER